MGQAAVDQSSKIVLERAIEGALAFLAQRVAEADFSAVVRTAFGDEADRKVVAEFLSELLIERKGPSVRMLPADALGGAKAAYAADGDTIFISAEFVRQHATTPGAIERVLLEELGHAIDARLGDADSPGDEGAIFARVVLGETISPVELGALRAENDHGTITVDGRTVEVEFAADYGSVTLDGSLAEWTAADRLDTPASGVSGYELYGRYTGDAFVFALKAPDGVAIGASTTFWLNTDRDTSTGHQIWGFAGGSEFNVNFDDGGAPYLFTGGAGEAPVAGPLDHSYDPSRNLVEFAVPSALLGGAQSADVLVDVNDQVFLPNDYSAHVFTVAQAAPPGPPPVAGDITLDGLLDDWTQAERLEVPGSGVAGYELYGKLAGDAYVFALKAEPVEIGADTTFWLNTDQDKATGYQIWGFAGGAEYNVNFTSKPYLYTGADGETQVGGELPHAFSADRHVVEFAVPVALLAGAPQAIDVLVDVNNQVFLPIDYSTYTYTVAAAQPPQPPPVKGELTLDGSLSDWTAADRLEKPGNGVDGYEVYGRVVGDDYVFAIKSEIAIGANTTVWFNVDQDTTTGYRIWGFAGGAEYNLNFAANGQPALYTGAAGETLVQAAVPTGISADGKIVEFAVSKSALGGASGNIDVMIDVNDQVFLPGDYGNPYTLRDTSNLPPRADDGVKVAIVYSETSAAQFYDLTNYSHLFMAAQYQATMAGVPFDVLSEADLTDIAKLANYDAIIFPSFRNVPAEKLSAIENALESAVYDYGISLIAAGDFMTNDAAGNPLAGDPYARMKSLLGVTRVDGGTGDIAVHAHDIAHSMMDGYQPNELIATYTNAGYSHFAGIAGTATVLVSQQVAGQTYNAVLATETGGKNVHFSSEALLGDNNLLWQALQWTVKEGDGPEVGLQMSRQSALVAARNDMDQSQESYDVKPDSGPGIYDEMLPILAEWKAAYDFVGSYYINIGNNPPDQMTNWAISAPYYQQLLAMGNEIGTHSYTHPHDTNELTPAEIEFEFNQSKLVIEQQLGIDVRGTAVPGDPEKLWVAQEIIQYFDYMSGGFSSVGAGYPGAFGYLTPGNADKVYLAPNMTFDFSLVGFQNLTPEQAAAKWAAEWAQLTSHTDVPILLWPWHDYGPTRWMVDPPEESKFTLEMYTSFIAMAAAAGSEFVTLADLAQRMQSFERAKIAYTITGNIVNASVISNDAGKFALDFDGGYKIQRVEGWFAYDDDSVFLPKTGGDFTVVLGDVKDDVTHIVSLPARGELLSVTGDGANLQFSLVGDGKVVIDLKDPAGLQVEVEGAEVVSLVGDRLELALVGIGRHDVTVTLGAGEPPPPDVPPVIVSNGGGETAAISIPENSLNVTTVKATDEAPDLLRYEIVGGADAGAFTIDEKTGALRFKVAPDFEAPTDAGRDNVYDVLVRAIDTVGQTDSQAIAVAVTDVPGVKRAGSLLGKNNLVGTDEGDTLCGGLNADTLRGLGGNDVLRGGFGKDTLYGGAGNDRLDGGWGADILIGGPGADVLTGGQGRDIFRYESMEDFGTLDARDVITDFRRNEDRIDLSPIDADAGVDGNQAFQFLPQAGAAFTAAGQVRYVKDAAKGVTYVEGNVNADLAPDFRIELKGLLDLQQSDFIL
jgi:serralysin